MKLAVPLAAAALATLAACGGGSPSDKAADQLENAAEQSDPAAAQILENAADTAREQNASEASNTAQQALNQAGNAAAATLPTTETPPPSLQAQPNRTGQQTPPPKTRADTAPGNSQ